MPGFHVICTDADNHSIRLSGVQVFALRFADGTWIPMDDCITDSNGQCDLSFSYGQYKAQGGKSDYQLDESNTYSFYIWEGDKWETVYLRLKYDPSPPSNDNGGTDPDYCTAAAWYCAGLACYDDNAYKHCDFSDCLCNFGDGTRDTYWDNQRVYLNGVEHGLPKVITIPYTDRVTVRIQANLKKSGCGTDCGVDSKRVYCNVKRWDLDYGRYGIDHRVDYYKDGMDTNQYGAADFTFAASDSGWYRVYISSGSPGSTDWCRANNECDTVIVFQVNLGTPTNLTIDDYPSAVVVNQPFDIIGKLREGVLAGIGLPIEGETVHLDVAFENEDWYDAGVSDTTDADGVYVLSHSFNQSGVWKIRTKFLGS